MSKSCSKCLILKDPQFFYTDKSKKDGLSSYCKECRIKQTKQHKKDNREKVLENQRRHYQENKVEIRKKQKLYNKNNKEKISLISKKWRDSNKDHSRAYFRKYKKNRKQVNPLYKIKENLRNRLYYALNAKRWNKNTHFNEYTGCTLEELKTHIEKQFKNDMTWENYGSVWQLDHIKNLASAKDEKELYKYSHYTNLQPLTKKEHLIKTIKERYNVSTY